VGRIISVEADCVGVLSSRPEAGIWVCVLGILLGVVAGATRQPVKRVKISKNIAVLCGFISMASSLNPIRYS
jgi:hypothetical protein